MSIATKTGDDGTTALMYNRRVSKCDTRVEACGTVDELNAALGVARACATAVARTENLASIQKDLILIMGELATVPDDLARYVRDGNRLASGTLTSRLDAQIADLEAKLAKFSGWATPGGTPEAAALDLARTICRRAERCVCRVQAADGQGNAEIIVFLNRLSDLLWLLARQAEVVSK